MKKGVFKLLATFFLSALLLPFYLHAKSLEEAIKDIKISGEIKGGYYHQKIDPDPLKDFQDSSSSNLVEYRGILRMATPVINGLQMVMEGLFQDRNGHIENIPGSDRLFSVYQLYGTYILSNSKTNIILGRQYMDTPFTNELISTGFKVTNKDLPGWVFSIVAFKNMKDRNDELYYYISDLKASKDKHIKDKKFYGIGAEGSFGVIPMKIWVGNIDEVTSNIFAEAKYGINYQGFDIGVTGQYCASSIDDRVKELSDMDDSTYYGVCAKVGNTVFNARAGYTYIETENNKKGFVAFQNVGSFISAGEMMKYKKGLSVDLNYGETKTWFIATRINILPIKGLTLRADYVNVENSIVSKDRDAEEFVIGGKYRFNKKLNFKTWYSIFKDDSKNTPKIDQSTFHFEAKYKF
ncbi:MAG: major outer membrane protein [Epsilonproteobacteria bacterium]|nr:major outer membrane protein [Campylobacterota bacterium]